MILTPKHNHKPDESYTVYSDIVIYYYSTLCVFYKYVISQYMCNGNPNKGCLSL